MNSLLLVRVDSVQPLDNVRYLGKWGPPPAGRRRKRTKLNDVLGLEDRAEKVNALVKSVHQLSRLPLSEYFHCTLLQARRQSDITSLIEKLFSADTR